MLKVERSTPEARRPGDHRPPPPPEERDYRDLTRCGSLEPPGGFINPVYTVVCDVASFHHLARWSVLVSQSNPH